MERSSGVLLHISSLPGEGGIGCLGKDAFQFVDFLAQPNRRYGRFCHSARLDTGIRLINVIQPSPETPCLLMFSNWLLIV
jgi:hypothetical protein